MIMHAIVIRPLTSHPSKGGGASLYRTFWFPQKRNSGDARPSSAPSVPLKGFKPQKSLGCQVPSRDICSSPTQEDGILQRAFHPGHDKNRESVEFRRGGEWRVCGLSE